MKINLKLNLGPGLLLDNATVGRPLTGSRASELRQMPYLGGEVEIVSVGKPSLKIHDDLGELIPRLCLDSLASLEEGKTVQVALFTDPNEVKLIPDGKKLFIVAPDGVKQEYDFDQALIELEACGARFVKFIEENFPGNPTWDLKLSPFQLILLKRQSQR